jgi:hypothetical protein
LRARHAQHGAHPRALAALREAGLTTQSKQREHQAVGEIVMIYSGSVPSLRIPKYFS